MNPSKTESLDNLQWLIKDVLKIVLFKSLGNCKKHNKGNFTLKSNSNKIMCGAILSCFK